MAGTDTLFTTPATACAPPQPPIAPIAASARLADVLNKLPAPITRADGSWAGMLTPARALGYVAHGVVEALGFGRPPPRNEGDELACVWARVAKTAAAGDALRAGAPLRSLPATRPVITLLELLALPGTDAAVQLVIATGADVDPDTPLGDVIAAGTPLITRMDAARWLAAHLPADALRDSVARVLEAGRRRRSKHDVLGMDEPGAHTELATVSADAPALDAFRALWFHGVDVVGVTPTIADATVRDVLSTSDLERIPDLPRGLAMSVADVLKAVRHGREHSPAAVSQHDSVATALRAMCDLGVHQLLVANLPLDDRDPLAQTTVPHAEVLPVQSPVPARAVIGVITLIDVIAYVVERAHAAPQRAGVAY